MMLCIAVVQHDAMIKFQHASLNLNAETKGFIYSEFQMAVDITHQHDHDARISSSQRNAVKFHLTEASQGNLSTTSNAFRGQTLRSL